MYSCYRFTYIDQVFAHNKEEAKKKLLDVYMKEGPLELLELLFDDELGGKLKRTKWSWDA